MADKPTIEVAEKWWSCSQVARALNVTDLTVERWCNAGLMDHSRIDGLIRISDSHIGKFLRQVRVEARKAVCGKEVSAWARQIRELSYDPEVPA